MSTNPAEQPARAVHYAAAVTLDGRLVSPATLGHITEVADTAARARAAAVLADVDTLTQTAATTLERADQTERTARDAIARADAVAVKLPAVEAAAETAETAADRAEAAADRVGAPLITTTDPGFEGAVGDADGRPSWLRYDTQGLPTPYVADALGSVGVPHAEDSGDGLTIAGEDGTPTWLSATGEGGPDGHALTWLANALHVHVGPDEPEVYPGGWIVWTRTDAHGTPIETLIGRN